MRIIPGVLAMTILAAASTASGGERPTVGELLAACQKSFERLARVRIECTETMTEPKLAGNGVSEWKRDLTILREASRWKVDEIQRGKRQVDGQPAEFGFWHQTLVGDEVIQAQLFNPPPQDVQQRPIVTAFRDAHTHRVWSILRLPRTIFGRLEGDGGLPLWTVMGEDTVLELFPEPEKIGHVETWILKSRGRYGEHKVWFDPANGGLPRRIEVRKQLGDLLNDEQLGSRAPGEPGPTNPERGQPQPPAARKDVFVQLDNIQIENKSGLFVMTAFDYRLRYQVIKTQKEIERREELRVRTIDVDPKPGSEDAFQFDIKIPNELRVGIFTNAPLEFGSARADTYEEWIDGKLRKRPGQ